MQYDPRGPNGFSLGSCHKMNRAIIEARAPGLDSADLGGILIPGSPADFGKVVADETEKWAKVIKAGGVALE